MYILCEFWGDFNHLHPFCMTAWWQHEGQNVGEVWFMLIIDVFQRSNIKGQKWISGLIVTKIATNRLDQTVKFGCFLGGFYWYWVTNWKDLIFLETQLSVSMNLCVRLCVCVCVYVRLCVCFYLCGKIGQISGYFDLLTFRRTWEWMWSMEGP